MSMLHSYLSTFVTLLLWSGSNLYTEPGGRVDILITEPCSSVFDAVNEISEEKIGARNIVATSNLQHQVPQAPVGHEL